MLLVLILQPSQGTEWVRGGDCGGIGQETVHACALLLLSTPHDCPLPFLLPHLPHCPFVFFMTSCQDQRLLQQHTRGGFY